MRWKKNKSGQGGPLVERALATLGSPSKNGTIVFNYLVEFDFLSALLDSHLEPSEIYPEQLKLDFIRAGLIHLKKFSNNPTRFIQTVTSIEEKYTKAKIDYFYMGASLSIASHSLQKEISLHYRGDYIKLSSRYPKKFERADFFINGFGDASSIPEFNFSILYTKLKARNITEAGLRGIETLNFIRGLINLYLNKGKFKLVSGKAKPFNEVLFGQYQPVFASSGMLERELVWYEPNYQDVSFPKVLRGGEINLGKFLREQSKYMKSNPLEGVIRKCVILYSKALDEKDKHNSIVRLWSLLEIMTNSTRLDSKKTAWRTSFLYRDRDDVQEKILYIAEIRNRYIHLDAECPDVDTSHHLVRIYVERLLLFLIQNKLKFSSVEKAGIFFEMSNSRTALRHEIRNLQKVYRFVR